MAGHLNVTLLQRKYFIIKYKNILIDSRQKQLTSCHARQTEKCRLVLSNIFSPGWSENYIIDLITAVGLTGLFNNIFSVPRIKVDVCNGKKYCSHQTNDLWKLCHVKQSSDNFSTNKAWEDFYKTVYHLYCYLGPEIAHSQLREQIALTFLAMIFFFKKRVEQKERSWLGL